MQNVGDFLATQNCTKPQLRTHHSLDNTLKCRYVIKEKHAYLKHQLLHWNRARKLIAYAGTGHQFRIPFKFSHLFSYQKSTLFCDNFIREEIMFTFFFKVCSSEYWLRMILQLAIYLQYVWSYNWLFPYKCTIID